MVELLRIVERIQSWRTMAAGSAKHTMGLTASFTSNILQELQAWADKNLGSNGRHPYNFPGKSFEGSLARLPRELANVVIQAG